MNISRIDQSMLGRWWWTVDRWTVVAIGILCAFGAILTLAASPAVAERIGTDSFHFVRHQLALMPVMLTILFGISLQSPRDLRRLALFGLVCSLLALAATFVIGVEIKGARRWISLAGFSVEPSEFVKPCFAIVCAWLFTAQKDPTNPLPGYALSIGLFGVTLALLLLQPDLGQAVVISAVWFFEFFLAGLPVILVVALVALAVVGMIGAYEFFPHVQSRIDRFLDPSSGDSYQITRSLEAFGNGSLWGRGPGEGTVKDYLPDAHEDFALAVAGEEFGLIICLLIVGIFAFIVLRGFKRLQAENNLFVVLAGTGLLVQFGLQAIINMSSALHLIPTKGMTLPFLSYGGSSLIALGFGMGTVLAFTRRRYGRGD